LGAPIHWASEWHSQGRRHTRGTILKTKLAKQTSTTCGASRAAWYPLGPEAHAGRIVANVLAPSGDLSAEIKRRQFISFEGIGDRN
jgi:hypothetical protein